MAVGGPSAGAEDAGNPVPILPSTVRARTPGYSPDNVIALVIFSTAESIADERFAMAVTRTDVERRLSHKRVFVPTSGTTPAAA